MTFYLKGESGYPLDATPRSLESLIIPSAVLTFRSLDRDTLVFQITTADAAGTGSLIPVEGQIVELYADTTRKFRGHVTLVTVGMRHITVTVDGPFWWMTRIPLTSSIAAPTGPAAERAQYVFPTQSLATSIGALLARAVTNGVPMAIGDVDAIYSVPRITLSNTDCANALATLMAWCPDIVARFDYRGTGLPALHLKRRGNMAAVTLTIGVDAVIDSEIEPRLDLEVTSNEVHYVTRNATTGKPSWAAQTSGTAAPGKRQIVTVSGPEIVDILPRDDFDSITLTTTPVATLALQYYDAAVNLIRGAKGSIGEDFSQIGGYVQQGTGYSWMQNRTYNGLPESSLPANVTAWHFTPELAQFPDWAIAMLAMRKITITAGWYVHTNAPASAAFTALCALPGAISGNLYGPYPTYTVSYYVIVPLTVEGWITATALSATTLYKPWEYDYLTPPAGLAANLVAAQNWVPWEGPINLIGDDCTADNLLVSKYNLAAALPVCATMEALAKACSHDLINGRTVITLGAPARLDYGIPLAQSDGLGNLIQYHTGLLLWTSAGGSSAPAAAPPPASPQLIAWDNNGYGYPYINGFDGSGNPLANLSSLMYVMGDTQFDYTSAMILHASELPFVTLVVNSLDLDPLTWFADSISQLNFVQLIDCTGFFNTLAALAGCAKIAHLEISGGLGSPPVITGMPLLESLILANNTELQSPPTFTGANCPLLTYLDLSGCTDAALTDVKMDTMYSQLDALTIDAGAKTLIGNGRYTSASATARTSLTSKGWTITL